MSTEERRWLKDFYRQISRKKQINSCISLTFQHLRDFPPINIHVNESEIVTLLRSPIFPNLQFIQPRIFVAI